MEDPICGVRQLLLTEEGRMQRQRMLDRVSPGTKVEDLAVMPQAMFRRLASIWRDCPENLKGAAEREAAKTYQREWLDNWKKEQRLPWETRLELQQNRRRT